ncbi:MAG: acyl-CoA dehydrogenase family protein [Burkholderiales bacterium]|nr:acyl-CoA dehydrogenase family protein [Burkholderiales bacterium]
MNALDTTFLSWPFFEPRHRSLAAELEQWARVQLGTAPAEDDDVDASVRDLAARLGAAGWLRYVLPKALGGVSERLDVRSLCLIRETLARYSGLADFTFAMQGLGSGPITLFGSPQQQQRYLPEIATGRRIAAFALSEHAAGSDVAALSCIARREGEDYILDGSKTWISNAGVASQYVLFARTGEAPGAKGLSAFIVDADTPGLGTSERIEVTAPHALGTLRLDSCRVSARNMIGSPGQGFRIAMATLDVFRATVGAAALGFARRALAEAAAHVRERVLFGSRLSQMQATRMRVSDMALEIDAAALLVYRAAWVKDFGAERVTREASMAKLYATEAAQRVIDSAVQLFGGIGVTRGSTVERLYREIRPLRIYEGTSEIQKLVIATQVLGAD